MRSRVNGSGRVVVNGRTYAWPRRRTVVLSIDGSAPDYIVHARRANAMPNMKGLLNRGTDLRALSAMPSFTNPNNLSIATGCTPAVHGISGNFFLDQDSGRRVLMNDPSFLRVPTIFAAFQGAGARVTVITAKDKLRRLLGHGLVMSDAHAAEARCFSAECADSATMEEHGIADLITLVGRPLPHVYSAALSEFVMASAVKLLEREGPDLMYLSTTDFVQHQFAPGSGGANEFYSMLDEYIGVVDGLGCTLVIVADHGMNAMHDAAGKPNVIYLQDVLDSWIGPGETEVICPITDPYVRHHGALGSFVTVYLPRATSVVRDDLLHRLRGMDGIGMALSRADAATAFELPVDRIGDIVVTSECGFALGSSAAAHDLTGLHGPLRTHGGVAEQTVPFIVNGPVVGLESDRVLRNFDAFDIALNYTDA